MVNDGLVVRVECYAGHKGDETPRRFFLDDRVVDVAEVLDRWLGLDHAYYKVLGADRTIYILRRDKLGHWQLIMLDRRPGQAPSL